MGGFPASFHHRSEGPEIFHTPIRAGAQEDIVDGFPQQAFPGAEIHIVQGLDRCIGGDGAVNGHAHARIGAVGDHGRDGGRIVHFLAVKNGIFIAAERFPLGDGLVPGCSLGCIGLAFQVGEGYLVRGDKSAAGPHLDGQVAQGKPPFHRQVAHGGTGILYEIPRCTGGGKLLHQVQGDIFRGDPFPQRALDADAHRFGLLLQDALRSQHHLHFGGADAECDGTHRPVGGGVRIAADDGHSRQGQPLLRSYYVDDPVARIHHPEMFQTELAGVGGEGLHLFARNRILDGFVLVVRGRIMVRHAENLVRTQAADAALAQPLESLRAGNFVAIQPVYVKLDGPGSGVVHHVGVPDFVEKRIHFTEHLFKQST